MTDPRPTRPALPTLQRDQRALIHGAPKHGCPHGLRDGFPSRRDAIAWYQRAVVRTVGRIAEPWPPAAFLQDATLVAALVSSERRQRFADLDDAVARSYRERLERTLLLPACNEAYNEMARHAGEYVEKDDDPVDPQVQDHVAMRPGFQEADDRQQQALADLWDGFDSRRELLTWLHGLDAATNGAVDETLASRVSRDEPMLEALLDAGDDASRARAMRERFAVVKLLPAFVEGIRSMDAGELTTRTSSEVEVAPG